MQKHIFIFVAALALLAACGTKEKEAAPPAAAEAPKAAEPAPATSAATVKEGPAAPAATARPARETAAPAASPPATPKAAEPAPATSAAPADLATGENVYKKTCSMCHQSGVGGAPRHGNKEEWAPRIAQGKEVLYGHAINGFRGSKGFMPARGSNFSLSDAEVKAAVDFMAGKAQ